MTTYNLDSEINLQIQNLKKMTLDGSNLSLSDSQSAAFALYTHLLIEWNEKVNLTAITDPREIMIKHFLDSFVFVDRIRMFCPSASLRLGDLGTGAGFPGVPVKILMPDIEVVLIDALLKRINFLNEIITRLSLSGIQTCHARAEDIGRDSVYRESFDVITARAVAELPVLLEYAAPLLKIVGSSFCCKGNLP
jgi:16S rRNA (guanine527-N7)-methyltransferase